MLKQSLLITLLSVFLLGCSTSSEQPVPSAPTPVAPTATPVPPTATSIPPTATSVPSTATPILEPTATPTATPIPTPTATPTPMPTVMPSAKPQGLQLAIVDHAGYGDTPASYPTDILWKVGGTYDFDHGSKWCEQKYSPTPQQKSCTWDAKVGYWVKGARTYLVKATNPNSFPVFIRSTNDRGRRPDDFLSKWLIGDFETRQDKRWRNTESCSIVNQNGKPIEDVSIEYTDWIFKVLLWNGKAEWSVKQNEQTYIQANLNPVLGPGQSNYFQIKLKANPQNTRNRLDFTVSESVYFSESCTFHNSKYWDIKKDAWIEDVNNDHTAIQRADGIELGNYWFVDSSTDWLSYIEDTTGAPNGWIQLKDLPEEISLQKVKREGGTSTLEVRLENRSEETWHYAYTCVGIQEPEIVTPRWYLTKYSINTDLLENGEDLKEQYTFWVKRGSMPRSIQNIYTVRRGEVSSNAFVEFNMNDSQSYGSSMRNRLGCVDQSLDSLWFYRDAQ